MLSRIMPLVVLMIAIHALSPQSARAQSERQLDSARQAMVDNAIIAAGVTNDRVIESMRSTKRHEFVSRRLRRQAYQDGSLPIGDGQTISSPFIVAYMTESLDPQPTDRVLEIGTGSGYQAAILSPLVDEVYTIEIVEALGRRAKATLERLEYDNVFTKIGDGYQGWDEHAPFDKIIVTCSPEKVPQPLVDQLKEGGLMVIPVGERYQQTLVLMRKVDGELESESLRPTVFVPMTGRAEEQREVQPDPTNPTIANGDFEEGVDEDGFIKGWYYQRQLEWEEDRLAPGGTHFVRFDNDDVGRAAHLMQVFAVDGRHVELLELSVHVRTELVFAGPGDFDMPFIGVSFYDEDRADLGGVSIGPFIGSSDWHRVSKRVPVPDRAREAIVRIGMFGSTGTVDFDKVGLVKIEQ